MMPKMVVSCGPRLMTGWSNDPYKDEKKCTTVASANSSLMTQLENFPISRIRKEFCVFLDVRTFLLVLDGLFIVFFCIAVEGL